VVLANGFAFLFSRLVVLMALLFVYFVVTEAAPEMRRLALAVMAQSVATMPQPIPLRIADVFTE
jgi:hypothetical protein